MKLDLQFLKLTSVSFLLLVHYLRTSNLILITAIPALRMAGVRVPAILGFIRLWDKKTFVADEQNVLNYRRNFEHSTKNQQRHKEKKQTKSTWKSPENSFLVACDQANPYNHCIAFFEIATPGKTGRSPKGQCDLTSLPLIILSTTALPSTCRDHCLILCPSRPRVASLAPGLQQRAVSSESRVESY